MHLRRTLLVLVACLIGCSQTCAQDIEPRRWTPLPVGLNVVGAGYGFTNADIFFDPVLDVQNAEMDLHTTGVSYVRSFSLWGRFARFDALVPWHSAEWNGLLEGQPARVTRVGHGDPILRLSWNLIGTPAMNPSEYRDYIAANPVNTVVGAAVAVTVPVGENLEDKLLNLGQNRWVVRPQVGVVHTRGLWSWELTASTFLFEDNDEFFSGNKLEQDPIYAMQGHMIRFFRSGVWVSASAAYGWKGRTEVNDEIRDEKKNQFLSALSFGFPVGRNQGVKIAYIRGETRVESGSDSNTLAVAWTMRY